jgi:hypothetical protein
MRQITSIHVLAILASVCAVVICELRFTLVNPCHRFTLPSSSRMQHAHQLMSCHILMRWLSRGDVEIVSGMGVAVSTMREQVPSSMKVRGRGSDKAAKCMRESTSVREQHEYGKRWSDGHGHRCEEVTWA